jgi:hypothetical protein
MKLAVIGAGKWGHDINSGRIGSKAPVCLLKETCHLGNFIYKRLLTLSSLTMRHLVPYLHCDLVACQQRTQAAGRFKIKPGGDA